MYWLRLKTTDIFIIIIIPIYRKGVQSMWDLNTTSSHSVFSEPMGDELSRAKGQAVDKAYHDVNAELQSK